MTFDALEKVFFSVGSLSGVGGALAWLSPRLILGRLVDHLLEKKLASFKDAQNREIERLRSELRHLEDRGVRSNEREYEALVQAWGSFIDAYYATYSAIGGLRSRPNLDTMTDEEVDEWLETSEVSKSSKHYVKTSTRKSKALLEIERGKDINECSARLWDARTAVRRQSVFIPEHIEKQFENALAALSKVWAEQHTLHAHPGAGAFPTEATMQFVGGQGETIRFELRDLVRKRLLRD